MVSDSASAKPLGYVTIALVDAATKQPVKSTLTKEDGTFILKGVAPRPYILSFIYVGYQTKSMPVAGDDDFMAGPVSLAASNSQLKEVSVSTLKPLMKQEVDRMTYDVAADPESKMVTALDMMRKVPLLSVDGSDNIMLRGNGNYKILLNGKESALLARNPSDILKAMPASNIVRIEVITTPPAKYDAEGLAGIINIITKTNGAQGYNGSFNGGYNSVWGERLNLNTTIKQGKFGLSGFVGTSNKIYREAGFINRTAFFNTPSSLYQDGYTGSGNRNTFANAELSYEIDSLNLLAGTLNLSNSDSRLGNEQFTQIYNAANALTQNYHVQSAGTGNGHGIDAGLNYQLGFKHNKGRLLTLSYKYSNASNRQDNDILTNQQNAANYRQHNNAGSKEYTTQVDYIHPLKTVIVEAGGKMILRNNFSNFTNDVQNTAGNYAENPALSNNFTYHQDVYSLYNSYTVKFTKWVLKGGARLERTNIDASFALAAGGNFSRDYHNLVPSISVQRTLNSTSGINFGFTQRIQRPGIAQLNPFTDSTNTLIVNRGNPALVPAVNNNFELSYNTSRKGNINLSASYMFANNTIQTISLVTNNVTTNTFANLGKTRQAGLDLNVNYPVTKRFTAIFNLELLQIWLEGTYNGTLLKNSGQQGHAFTNYNYRFDNGYRVGANIGYDSRYVFLQGRDNWYFGNGLWVAKEILKKAGTISLALNNPFDKFNKFDFFYKTPDFASVNQAFKYYRTININFNFKFGKLNSDIKKNQRGINNDDTAAGR